MPATEFSGASYFGDDARENVRVTVDQLIPVLGHGEATLSSNCVGHRWAFGAASLELFAWPPDMQSWPMKNPAHEREPRLRTSCVISVKTGFRPQANEQERRWLGSFEPVARIIDEPTSTPGTSDIPVPQRELEFIRIPDKEFSRCYGWIGCSADRSALIFFARELYVVPLDDVIQFEVARILPAKGRGGSWLTVQCRCHYAGQLTKTLAICSASGPEDLNELGAAVAKAVGKPLVLLPHDYDV